MSFVAKKSGFTLVELLIVIAIVVLLMSIIGVATMSMVGSARVFATKATITKVQGLLQNRIDAVSGKKADQTLTRSLNVPGRFPNIKAAEAMARKFRFRNAFPQTWAEVPAEWLNGATVPMATVPPRPQESGEVLYFLLTQANILGYPPEGQDAFSSSEVKDTDSPPNGRPELIDSWGKPLRFYRWPTRLVRGGAFAAGGFTPSTTAKHYIPSLPTTIPELTRDADDPYGTLKVGAAITASEAGAFEIGGSTMGVLRGFPALHTVETFSLPLIVSAGADQILGLHEPGDTTSFGFLGNVNASSTTAAFDDISNYNIRSGGK